LNNLSVSEVWSQCSYCKGNDVNVYYFAPNKIGVEACHELTRQENIHIEKVHPILNIDKKSLEDHHKNYDKLVEQSKDWRVQF